MTLPLLSRRMATAVPMSSGERSTNAHAANNTSNARFHAGRVKRVEHLPVGTAEFLHFVLLAYLQEPGHAADALCVGLRRQCVADACQQIGLALFCLQSFGDKGDVDAWKSPVKAGDVEAVLFGVGLLVKDGCVIPFADASMMTAALSAQETVTNMPSVTLLRWSMAVWPFPM